MLFPLIFIILRKSALDEIVFIDLECVVYTVFHGTFFVVFIFHTLNIIVFLMCHTQTSLNL